MPDEFRQSFTLFPRRFKPWIWMSFPILGIPEFLDAFIDSKRPSRLRPRAILPSHQDDFFRP